ncbi:hypothetical protein HN652_02560 [archaeon]|nr:hypothetical protein [archaeon]
MKNLKLFYQQKEEDTFEVILQAERIQFGGLNGFQALGPIEWETRNYFKTLADKIAPKKYGDCLKHVYIRGVHQRKDRVIEVLPNKQLHSYLYVCTNQSLEIIKEYCTEKEIKIQQGIENKVRDAFF